MFIDNFFLVLFAMVVTLGMVKYATNRSNTLLTIVSLLCCFCLLVAIRPAEGSQWLDLSMCLIILWFTSQVYVGVIRKLSYTQEWVKRMTDQGWPKWLFYFITHPNPGPIPEKGVFLIMVYLLILNLFTLYFLIRMLDLPF